MKFRGTLAMLTVSVLFASACASGPLSGRETGALGGGALGAGAGAIIGHQKGKKAEGAAIGGAVGAVTGAIIGDQSDAAYQRGRY
jgi:uncharacterized protein YcfJ